jgi:hypothetical protein
VTLFVTRLTRDSGSDYDMARLNELAGKLKGKTVEDRIMWIIENFQSYSKIRKRGDVIIANFLTFFSPLTIVFDGKGERGYVITLVIGDSTTGKSETTKWCIRLLDGGQLVVAEMASMVGLSATTTQAGNGSWFVEWGPLVLGDRRRRRALDWLLRRGQIDRYAACWVFSGGAAPDLVRRRRASTWPDIQWCGRGVQRARSAALQGLRGLQRVQVHNMLPDGSIEIVERFDGSITLKFTTINLNIDATLVFGSARGGRGDYSFFAIYVGAELPAGIPPSSIPGKRCTAWRACLPSTHGA